VSRGRGLRQVGAVTALFTLLLVWYSVLVPMWRAPDEREHVDLVLDLAEEQTYPAWDENWFSAGVLNGSVAISGATNRTHLDGADAPPRATRPTLGELHGRGPSGTRNEMAQHPPAYYAALAAGYSAVTVAVEQQDLAAEQVVGLLRLLNIGLTALVPAICWWAARRAGLGRPAAAVASLVPLAIPGLLEIGSAVNNDNLLTVACGAAVALAVGVARGDARRSTAVALGLLTAVALLTKLFAVVLLPVIAAAYWAGRRRVPRGALRGPFVIAAGVAASGLWWYVVNLARYGAVNPSADTDRFGEAPASFTPDLHEWSTTLGTFLADGFWGRPGKFEAPLPNVYVILATVCLLGVAAFGAVELWRRRQGGAGGGALVVVLLLPLPGILAMVAGNSYRLYASSGVLAFMHGRYLMPAVTGVAVLFAAGVSRLLGDRPRLAVGVLLAAAVVMQRAALLQVLGHFWGPPAASLRQALRSAVAWSPWPGEVIGALALVSLAVGAGSLWALLVRPEEDDDRMAARTS
jgi:4-amino-4-deoxy-L-arabinose transferase-like glycosyltransferase